LARARGYVVVFIFIATLGASARNSSASRRVKFAPDRTQVSGKVLGDGIVASCESIDLSALMLRDLSDDVRGGTESVETDSSRIAREIQCAIAYQSGAEKGRGGGVTEYVRNCEAEALICNGELGIASVDLIAGETSTVAKVLAARAAIDANPARPSELRVAIDVLAAFSCLAVRLQHAAQKVADDRRAGRMPFVRQLYATAEADSGTNAKCKIASDGAPSRY
jgi:hypothetical protein